MIKEKKLSGPTVKKEENDLKLQLKARAKKENEEFDESQRKQIEAEEEMMRKHQEAKVAQWKEEQDDHLTKLNAQHSANSLKLKEDHETQVQQAFESFKIEQEELLSTTQKDQKIALEDHFTALGKLVELFHQDQSAILGDQHNEQISFKRKQNLESDIENLLKDQAEESKVLRQRQEKDLESLKRQKELDSEELESILESERKQLEEDVAFMLERRDVNPRSRTSSKFTASLKQRKIGNSNGELPKDEQTG